jgi:mono/diheme cytochrome c family protein
MNKHLKKALIVVAVLAFLTGILGWFKFCRVVAQPAWITSDQRDSYFYGSVGSAKAGGLPYWIWLAIPRLFPEHMPGPGGYAALGMSWEEGKEMPVGFAKQRVGYVRVTGNCALCHAMSRGNGQDEAPTILPVTKGHTTDIQPLLTFYRKSAQDPRFNADEFFSEINSDTRLSLVDRLLYRYVFIPRIRKALIDDPADVLFRPEIRAHARDPKSEAPLSDQELKALAAWMKQQSQTEAR